MAQYFLKDMKLEKRHTWTDVQYLSQTQLGFYSLH